MKKVLLSFIILIVLLFIWYGESRKVYHLNNGKWITVWKTFNDVCYVIPNKYYYLWKPNNNFIKTSNLNEQLTIFFTNEMPNTLIVQSEDSLQVYNKDGFTYLDYNTDSARLFQILYKPNGKLFYKDLKSNAELIDIDIKENYTKGINGEILNSNN